MTDILEYLEIPLVQNMFVAALIACVLCGVIGAYVVVNRMVAVTGGIAHTSFGGIGFAYYLMSVYAVSWMTPMLGAAIISVIAAVIMVIGKRFADLREDSVIGALWAVGMAMGVIFMCYMDRSVVVPSSYESILFGNMLMVSSSKLKIMALATIVILAVTAFSYRDLRIMTFDPMFAKISGIKVQVLDLILHVMIAITCVIVANVVGIIMIMALMTIPAAMGNIVAKDLKGTMVMGTLFAVSLTMLGIFISLAINSPPGASTVIVIGVAFMVLLVAKRIWERFAGKGKIADPGS